MIQRFIVILVFIFFIFSDSAVDAGQKIVAFQTIQVTPYEKVVKGFQSVCDLKMKRLITSEDEGKDIAKKITDMKPDLILAIGLDALSKVKGIQHIPVVYVMVLNPQSILLEEKNISGVSMNIPQEKQILMLLNLVPSIKDMGLLYDPRNSSHLVKGAQASAEKRGVNLMAKEVYSSKDVASLINGMKGKIDVFWMLPDTTVVTPETIESMLSFSLENKVPILTFSEKYVELGALLSIGIDAFDIGRQAGEMAKKILSEGEVRNIERVDARKAIISINLKVAKKLGIHLKERGIEEAQTID